MNPEDLTATPPARLPFPVTRALAEPVECRSDSPDDGIGLMTGRFSTFNDWYEVNSIFEGHFLERVASVAFKKTVAESRSAMKSLYDHGQDPQIGNKVLGPIRDLKASAAFEVPLFDTSYNRDLLPGLKAGVYGSSFRFSVEKDTWDHSPARSDYNPEGIPERTITEARVYEFGPVTFPANPNATAGVRSTTDSFYQRSRDPEAFESLLRSAQVARTPADTSSIGKTWIEGIAAGINTAFARTPATAGAAARSDEPPAGTRSEPPSPDTPRPPDPPPPVAAPAPKDPPEGGSSDSRSVSVPSELNTIEEKRNRHDELNDSLRAQSDSYPGRMPDDEQVRYDADKIERDDLKVDLDAWDARQKDLVATAAKPGTQERVFEPGQKAIVRKSISELHSPESRAATFEGRQAEYRDDAKRILETTKFAHVADKARTADKLDYLLDHAYGDPDELARRIKFTGSPVYMRAFEKIIKAKGSTISLTPEELRGTALAVGVDGTGGFAVPFAFDPTVIAIGVHGGAVNPYRATCRVVTIVGTDTWNALTATAVTATRTTEAAAAIEQGPTFAQPQYIVKRVQGQITASFEMFQDRTDLASEMASLIQEAKDNEEENSFAVGAGSGSAALGVGPVSGTSGAYTAVAGGGSGVIAAADADLTEAALPVRHRFGAQWFMNRLNIRKFQAVETAGGKLFGGNQYQAVGQVGLSPSGNTGLRLLGYPVNESPSLPVATTTTITVGTLLNPQSYVIVDRVGLSVQFIPFILNSSSLATGQQALYFLYRNHAAPINLDGGRTLRFL